MLDEYTREYTPELRVSTGGAPNDDHCKNCVERDLLPSLSDELSQRLRRTPCELSQMTTTRECGWASCGVSVEMTWSEAR